MLTWQAFAASSIQLHCALKDCEAGFSKSDRGWRWIILRHYLSAQSASDSRDVADGLWQSRAPPLPPPTMWKLSTHHRVWPWIKPQTGTPAEPVRHPQSNLSLLHRATIYDLFLILRTSSPLMFPPRYMLRCAGRFCSNWLSLLFPTFFRRGINTLGRR